MAVAAETLDRAAAGAAPTDGGAPTNGDAQPAADERTVDERTVDERLPAGLPAHLRDAARLGLTEVHPSFTMDKSKCIDCGMCREVCPFTAVRLIPTRWKISFEVVEARCHGCGGPSKAPCVRYCPSPGALVPVASAIVGA